MFLTGGFIYHTVLLTLSFITFVRAKYTVEDKEHFKKTNIYNVDTIRCDL